MVRRPDSQSREPGLKSSLNVIICSDLAAGSPNHIALFCDVSGGISPKRHGFTKYSYHTKDYADV